LAYWPELIEAASLPRYFLIGLFTSISLLVWAISDWNGRIVWPRGFTLILCFFGWAALSTSWSPDPGTSLIDITQLFNMILLAFLATQLFSRSSVFLSLLVPAILTGAALCAILGLGQYLGFNPLELRRNGNSIPATFINPNHAAVYFDFIPWLALFAILVFRLSLLRWLASISLGLAFTFILVNTSRGSLLAFITSSFVFILVFLFKPALWPWFKSRLLVCHKEIILALLIPFVIFLLPSSNFTATEQWDTSLLEGKVDLASQHRIAMYLNSIPAILDHPLTGLGYGGMRVGFLPYSNSVLPIGFRTEKTVLRELHSDPLQYFVEIGIPGGLLAIVIFYMLIRQGWKSFTPQSIADNRVLYLGIWLGLIAGGVHALVDFPLRLPSSAAMFWLYAGILVSLDHSGNMHLTKHSLRILRPVLLITGIASLVFTLIFYKAYLTANHDLYNSYLNLKKDCLAAERASRHGLDTFPTDFMLLTAYAQVYTVCNFTAQQKLTALNRVLALDPTNLWARLVRAELYNKANRPDIAIPEFERVATALPHRPYAYAGLGDSARLKGENQLAEYYYRAALKRKPDYEYVKRQLILLK